MCKHLEKRSKEADKSDMGSWVAFSSSLPQNIFKSISNQGFLKSLFSFIDR